MLDQDPFDYLDNLACSSNLEQEIGTLSTGERNSNYVALAANRPDLLCRGDSIAYAIWRLGSEWLAELIARHKTAYR